MVSVRGDEMKYTLLELLAEPKKTQEETAKVLAVSVQSYNDWEQNFVLTKVSNTNAIANLLGLFLMKFFVKEQENISYNS